MVSWWAETLEKFSQFLWKMFASKDEKYDHTMVAWVSCNLSQFFQATANDHVAVLSSTHVVTLVVTRSHICGHSYIYYITSGLSTLELLRKDLKVISSNADGQHSTLSFAISAVVQDMLVSCLSGRMFCNLVNKNWKYFCDLLNILLWNQNIIFACNQHLSIFSVGVSRAT